MSHDGEDFDAPPQHLSPRMSNIRQLEEEDDDNGEGPMGDGDGGEGHAAEEHAATAPAATKPAAAASRRSVAPAASAKPAVKSKLASKPAAGRASVKPPQPAPPAAAVYPSAATPVSPRSSRSTSSARSTPHADPSLTAAAAAAIAATANSSGVTQIHAILPSSKAGSAKSKPAATAARPKKPPSAAAAAATPVPVPDDTSPAEAAAVHSADDDDEDDDNPAPESPRPVPQQRQQKKSTLTSSASGAALKKKPAAAAPSPVSPPSPSASPSSLATSNFDFAAHASLSSLQDAHRALQAQLAQREAENSQMADALLTLQEELLAAESSSGSGTAAGVAKELARKNREAAVLLAKERARYEKIIDTLKKEHAQAMAEAQAAGSTTTTTKGPASPKRGLFAFGSTSRDLPPAAAAAVDPTVDSLEARLRDAQAAHASLQKQYQSKCSDLSASQSKVKALARALVREVDDTQGGTFKPEQVLDEAWLGKFKGRAQKIALLKDKVRELEKAVQRAQAGGDGPPVKGNASVYSGTSTLRDPVPDAQDLHEASLSKLASDRRADAAALKLQLAERTEEVEAWRKKHEAARSRTKILESELRTLKDSMRSLFDKSSQDDTLIDSLRAEMERRDRELAAAQEKLKQWQEGGSGGGGGAPSKARAASGSGAAAAAAVRGSYDATKLDAQEKLIAQLREQLRRVQAQADPEVASKLRDYAQAEHDTQLRLAQVENDKYREMVARHAQRIAELEGQLLQVQRKQVTAAPAPGANTAAPTSKSRTSLAQVGGARGTTFSSRPSGASSSSSSASASASASSSSSSSAPDPVLTLKSQLQSALSEQELIRSAYANTLANKDHDISILTDLINQKQAMYQSSIADMRKKFTDVTQAIR